MKNSENRSVSRGGPVETFVLLIWEEVPESMKMYLIPIAELTPDDIEVFRTANGKLQNTVGLTDEQYLAINKISNALCTKEEYVGDDCKGTRWAMRLAKYRVEDDGPIEGKVISSVYVTG